MRTLLVFLPLIFLYLFSQFLGTLFFRQSLNALNRETDRHLTSVAKAIRIAASPLSDSEETGDLPMDLFYHLEEQFLLETITLFDGNKRVIFSTNPLLDSGSKLNIESRFIDSTQGMKTFLCPLVNINGSRFKSLLVEVQAAPDWLGVSADLELKHLQPLEKFKTLFLIGTLVSLLLFVGLALALFQMLNKLRQSESEKRAQEKLALMGKMTASIAHEIKNPLGIIRASAQMAGKKYGDEQGLFHSIEEEIDRLDQNITDYLTFSRDITLRMETVDMEPIFIRMVKEFPQAHFEVSNLHHIQCDPFRMTQLLRNLLLNAIHHGGKIIAVKAKSDENFVQITVEDNGAGVGKDQMEKLFEPFHTSSPTGSGLGLSICKKIADLHGGELKAENISPHGARFTFLFPRSTG